MVWITDRSLGFLGWLVTLQSIMWGRNHIQNEAVFGVVQVGTSVICLKTSLNRFNSCFTFQGAVSVGTSLRPYSEMVIAAWSRKAPYPPWRMLRWNKSDSSTCQLLKSCSQLGSNSFRLAWLGLLRFVLFDKKRFGSSDLVDLSHYNAFLTLLKRLIDYSTILSTKSIEDIFSHREIEKNN